MKQGAIFDMDGLLFDTERVYQQTWVELAEARGLVPDPSFPKALAGTSGGHMYQVIRSFYPDADAEQMWIDCQRRVAEKLQYAVPEKPGVHEILDGLQAGGGKIAIASSSPASTIEQNLKNAGIRRYFHAVVSSAQVGRGKPFPDVFLAAAKALDLPPEDCYVFEDSPNGIRAGHAAGCTTIMIPDTIEPAEDVRRICNAICSSLLDAWKMIRTDRI